MMERTGRCQCGATRFAHQGPVNRVEHCHCESCRRASGAGFVTWVAAPREALRWTAEAPAAYESSPDTLWLRCADCGSLMGYDAARHPDEVHAPLAAYELQLGLTPERHACWAERVAWAPLDDDLPKETE